MHPERPPQTPPPVATVALPALRTVGRASDRLPPTTVAVPIDLAGPTTDGSGAPALGGLLETQPDTGTAALRRLASGVPDAAAFRLLGLRGAGGMGEVWEAWQTSLGRSVAVKRIAGHRLAGVPPDERRDLVDAFYQEAAAAARLEHPNILPIHDLARDAEGLPLLAMKLVQGRSWAEVIAEERGQLEVEEFLARHVAILADVAQAVAFAHSRGIIHRDLKPSQVMLGEFGEVLLMDWGLALQVERREASRLPPGAPSDLARLEPATRESQNGPAGTPALMAPEQTLDSAEAVGTWTDVYLLGGTLYYLLADRYPHGAEDVAASLAHARRGVVTPPSRLAPGWPVPEELEALCMEALEPDPARRGSEARQFVARLHDWLTGAHRRREARAHAEEVRGRLAGGATGFADLSACATRIEQAVRLAPTDLVVAEVAEEVGRRFAAAALAAGDLSLARLQAARLRDAEAGRRLMGEIDAAEADARRRERQRRVMTTASLLLLGLLVAGGAAFTFRLGRETTRARRAEQVAERRRGEAEDLVEFLIEDLRDRLAELGRLDLLDVAVGRAARYFEAEEAYRTTPGEIGELVNGLAAVGDVYRELGNGAAARGAYEHALRLAEPQLAAAPDDRAWMRHVAACRHHLALLAAQRGEAEVAVDGFRASLALMERVVEGEPASSERHAELAITLESLGDVHLARRQAEEALEAFRRAEALFVARLEATPGDAKALSNLAIGREKVSMALEALGRHEETVAAVRHAARLMDDALAAVPADAAPGVREEVEFRASFVRMRLGTLLVATGDAEGATAQFEAARDLLAGLVASDPSNTHWRRELTVAYQKLATLTMARGDRPAARAALAGGRDTMEELIRRDPTNANWRRDLATIHAWIGEFDREAGDAAGSLAAYERSRDLLEGLVASDPANVKWRLDLALTHNRVARLRVDAGEVEPGLAALRASRALRTAVAAEVPYDARMIDDLVSTLVEEGRVLREHGRGDEAAPVWEQVLELTAPDRRGAAADRRRAARVRALVGLGRREEALPLVAALREAGFDSASFAEFLEAEGLAAPPPAAPPGGAGGGGSPAAATP